MNKNQYIEQEIFSLTQSWGTFLLIAGAIVIMSLSFLDYVVTPENFTRFLIFRLISATLYIPLIIAHIRNAKYRSEKLQLLIFLVAPLIASIMVEAMILFFGGHQSPYYAGMIIVFAFIAGFLPLSTGLAVFLVILTLAIYIFPILLFDPITNYRIFVNNIFFLFSISMIGLIWRGITRSLLMKKLSLEYDLSQDKEQLQKYSTQLEELVAERTKELSISEQRYRALFDNANDGIVVLDKNGTIVSVNHSYCELYGFERDALIGTSFKLLEAKDSEDEVRERMDRILGGESLVFETENYRRDGGKILVEVSSRAIDIGGELYVQSFHRDIAEKKRLQEQLFQSQKMESIGVLAGGIAHDFNNILTAILAHTDMLQEFSNLDAAGKKRVKTIEMSARKAGQMVSKLLSFARRTSFDAVPIDLNAIVRDSAELIERMMKKQHIVLKVETDDAIPLIQGDGNQIEQVIMNLVVNAGDAMPHGGSITISTSVKNLGRDAFRVHPLLAPGRYVVLVISDTGTGIPEQIRDKIFDPFFTTKETGKGTGLGLATVYGIVKEHKGVINLKTEVGRGTTFEIFFPASRATPASRVTVRTAGKVPFSGEEEKT
jgi:PAS domain S-box-containing protein